MKSRIPILLLVFLLIPCWAISWKPGGDLGVYYKASEWLQRGWVTRLYSDNAEIGNFFYGPFGLAILNPLSLLSFHQANLLWLTLQSFSYFIFWFFLVKIFPEVLDPKRIPLFLLTWVVSIKPIHASFQSHNVQLMFAAILIFSEWNTQSKRKRDQLLSGILLSLLASIKIYPAFIALYYLLRKSHFVRLGLILGGLVSLVVPLLVFGFETGFSLPKQFVHNALHYHHIYDLSKDVVSLSLPSLLTTWLPVNWISAGAVSLITALMALLYFSWVFKTRRLISPQVERHSWAMSWAAMAMLNSTTRPDYFIFFVPAFISIPFAIKHSPRPVLYRVGLFISLALIAFITEWTLGSRDLTHYLESLRIPVIGVLLLCFMQFSNLRTMLKE
jgi:hypothetical protein